MLAINLGLRTWAPTCSSDRGRINGGKRKWRRFREHKLLIAERVRPTASSFSASPKVSAATNVPQDLARSTGELPTEQSRGFVIVPADLKTNDGAALISRLEGILVAAVPNWQRLEDSRLVAPLLLIGRPKAVFGPQVPLQRLGSPSLSGGDEVLCNRSPDQNRWGALAA